MSKPIAAIVGVGRTPFGEFWGRRPEDLIFEAGLSAILSVEKGVGRRDIQAFYVGSIFLGKTTNISTLGSYLSRELGIDVPVIASTTSSASLYNAVQSREFDLVCVGGIEKMTDSFTAAPDLLSTLIDYHEVDAGFTLNALKATIMNKYIHDFGAKREAFAKVPCKNHLHALQNQYAQYRYRLTVDRVLSSPLVADPLRVLECAPISDGAAAVVITKPEKAREYTDTPIYIFGSGQATDDISMYSRASLTELYATRAAVKRALSSSGVELKEIGLAEVHDATSLEEVLFLEDAGFVTKGLGWKVVDECVSSFEGSKHIPYVVDGVELVVNAGGGLKADGHPVGATGVRQVVEVFRQLRYEAESAQVDIGDRQYALVHDVEGIGSVVTVHILGRGS